MLEKYLNLEGFLEKSLKIKSALNDPAITVAVDLGCKAAKQTKICLEKY